MNNKDTVIGNTIAWVEGIPDAETLSSEDMWDIGRFVDDFTPFHPFRESMQEIGVEGLKALARAALENFVTGGDFSCTMFRGAYLDKYGHTLSR